jgi:DNA invertase Pin-like site-specific DNA recombinase
MEAQIASFAGLGCDLVVTETDPGHAQLLALVGTLGAGDEVLVRRLDALGEGTRQVLRLVQDLDGRGAVLRTLEPELTTAGDAGRIVVAVLRAVAEMDLRFVRARQRAGIDAARERGAYKFRRKSVDDAEIRRLAWAGVPKAHIARDLGVSRMSVYRALRTLRSEGEAPGGAATGDPPDHPDAGEGPRRPETT